MSFTTEVTTDEYLICARLRTCARLGSDEPRRPTARQGQRPRRHHPGRQGDLRHPGLRRAPACGPIARAAGVDAALIHHYFDGKAGLFMAAMALPFDPRQVQLAATARPPTVSGRIGSGRGRGIPRPCGTSPKARGRPSSPAWGRWRPPHRRRRHPRVRQGTGLAAHHAAGRGTSEATSDTPPEPAGVAVAGFGLCPLHPAGPAAVHRPRRPRSAAGSDPRWTATASESLDEGAAASR